MNFARVFLLTVFFCSRALAATDANSVFLFSYETKNPVKKHLRLAESAHANGAFGPAGVPITMDWVEGPSAIQVGSEFIIYFDHYRPPQYYGAVKSADMKNWQDVSAQVSFPKGARHGTVLKVPEPIVRSLQNTKPN